MNPSLYRIVEGRRPEGMVMPESAPGAPVLGDYFARAAYHEAASASACARLGRELEAHGAPTRLVNACERAHLAELRHAQIFGRIAESYGLAVTTPEPRLFGVRPLVAVALENVVEGFVRQTYGAVASRFRARSAGNLKIRRVMEEIAADEREHAQLAMETARWLQGKMDRIEIVWLENAMRHAVSTLGRQLDAEAHIDLSWEVGVPSRRDALAIWTGLSRRVWNVTSESMWSAAA